MHMTQIKHKTIFYVMNPHAIIHFTSLSTDSDLRSFMRPLRRKD